MGVTYDAGAIIAAERNDRRMWALHAGLLSESVVPTVPAPVLTQTWRGRSHQANVARFLRPCAVDQLDEASARQAGELLGRADRSDVTDAVVVVGALRRGDAVVTSDPDDLHHLAAAVDARLVTEPV